MQRKLETSREKLRIARSGSISTTNLRAGEGPGGGGVEGGAGGDVEDALRDALCLKTRELEDVKAQLVALRHRVRDVTSNRSRSDSTAHNRTKACVHRALFDR